ncbi:response regulator [Inhella gelatinilytica]|uniref:Response regulator n=1 Tax=Inhella gelatinilytica TaxID=2795030 RepID=A0A931IYZ1_9BURK|nr:response regulator [Inhella gelatinilytica]MBH9553679.1 response regulator [Inhella gelatinilytica]
MATILVVDDELGIRGLLSEILSDEGHTVELAENAAEARAARERIRPDLVLLDIWMPDVDGITLLKEWSGAGLLTMPVVMMSGHGTIDTAVEATKHGAMAFLEKPITLQKLLRAVDQGLTRNAPKPPAPPVVASWSRVEGGYAAVGLPASTPHAVTLGGHAMHHGFNGPAPEQLFQLDRPLREARDAFEKSYFEFHLAKENGSMTRVAEKTGLERTHLYRKLKQLGVDIARNKRGI